jgi:outer membrane protein assembly factor BamD
MAKVVLDRPQGAGHKPALTPQVGIMTTRFRMGSISALAAAGALVGALGLAGCTSDEPAAAPYVERPVDQIYSDAWKQIRGRNWKAAAQQFDEVERQHPYSEWSRRGILMAAYSYYQANMYEQAIETAERFIKLHPGNKDVPYAYYLKAVSLYEQITDVGRDQAKTQAALVALQDLVQRYPSTNYARDARLKIDLTRDHLAGKEMSIGRFYLRAGDELAAINRFRIVIEQYQTTTHTPEALERLTEAYLSLGIVKEAQTAAAVLGYNYPGSPWYEDAYDLLTGAQLKPEENKDSWISRAFNRVF